MNCPICKAEKPAAVKTYSDDPEWIIRARKCKNCGHSFYTMEKEIPAELIKIVRNNKEDGGSRTVIVNYPVG